MQENKKPYSPIFKFENLQIKESKILKVIPDPREIPFGEIISDHMLYVCWSEAEGWSDPEIMEYIPLHLNATISSVHYGISVFEGMKAFKSGNDIVIFRPFDHLKRLRNSASRMMLPDFDENELFKCLEQLLILEKRWILDDAESSLYIRPILFSSDESLNPKSPRKAILIVLLSPVCALYKSGSFNPISLLADPQYSRSFPGGCGGVKTGCNYGPSLFTKKIAESKGCNEVLWLFDEYITEIGTMNFFFIKQYKNGDLKLVTPPIEDIILDGITRKSILEMMQTDSSVKIKIAKTKIEKLVKQIQEKKVVEMFGSGTAGVVQPIGKILYKDKWYELNYPNPEKTTAARIKEELTKKQRNIIPNNWAYVIHIQ